MSAMPSIATKSVVATNRRRVPRTDSCTAANSISMRSPHGEPVQGIGAAAVFVDSPIPTRRDGVILAVAKRGLSVAAAKASSAPILFDLPLHRAGRLLHDISSWNQHRQTNHPW